MEKLSTAINLKSFYSSDSIEQSCCFEINQDIKNVLERYNIDDVDEININSYNLGGRYAYWNRELFNNELPTLKEIAFKKIANGITGKAIVNGILQKGNHDIVESYDWASIHMSKLIKYTQKILDIVLIHEMIHIYYMCVQKMNIHHDKPFQDKAKELGEKIGLVIPLTDSITEFKAHEESLLDTTIIVLEFPSTYAVCFFPMKKFEESKYMVADYFKRTIEEFKHMQIKLVCGIGKHGLTQKYPIQRSYKNVDLRKITQQQIREIKWKNGTVTEGWLDEL